MKRKIRTEIGECVIKGNFSQETKAKMIKERLANGWRCYNHRGTGVRHIWMPPIPVGDE
jgi:hypothetical protein